MEWFRFTDSKVHTLIYWYAMLPFENTYISKQGITTQLNKDQSSLMLIFSSKMGKRVPMESKRYYKENERRERTKNFLMETTCPMKCHISKCHNAIQWTNGLRENMFVIDSRGKWHYFNYNNLNELSCVTCDDADRLIGVKSTYSKCLFCVWIIVVSMMLLLGRGTGNAHNYLILVIVKQNDTQMLTFV